MESVIDTIIFIKIYRMVATSTFHISPLWYLIF